MCIGRNTYGQLGYEDTNHRGDGLNEMGDFLSLVNMGSNVIIKAVDSGFSNFCVLSVDGTAKCFGAGTNGQLGSGDDVSVGDTAGSMGDNLGFLDLGADFIISALSGTIGYVSSRHHCALNQESAFKCWGILCVQQI